MRIKNTVFSRIFLSLILVLGVQTTTQAGVASPQFGDFVWNDIDGDLFPDIGEPGIGGVTVELCGVDSLGNKDCSSTVSTLTDEFGNYSLQGAFSSPDGYFVTAITPSGFVNTTLSSIFFDGTTTGIIDNADFGFQAAVPVPAAVWLFGSGLLGLISVARRKRVT